jgi:hypothetical protein
MDAAASGLLAVALTWPLPITPPSSLGLVTCDDMVGKAVSNGRPDYVFTWQRPPRP